MNLTTEQLAELLYGIARSQQAIIDAIESENSGWRNTHLLPKLNTAANLRLATSRLQDIPSRILLRSQGRIAMDVVTIARALEEAANGATVEPTASATPAAKAAGVAAPVAAVAAAALVTDHTAGTDFDNFFEG